MEYKLYEFYFFKKDGREYVIVESDDIPLSKDIDWDDIMLTIEDNWVPGIHDFEYCLDYSTWLLELSVIPKKRKVRQK
ncbi:MAG: hypothetical protein P1Q69_06980 [Candidatus Thorarchaeota archaeon]|nr:hypothetical protein [Candidatus Thorarchaeota archaeon]